MSCQHRSAAYDHRRKIDPKRCHQHARYNLVTVRHQYKSVKTMRRCHGFNRIRNQFTGCQRIMHSLVSHNDSIAHADGGKFYRCTACHADTGLNRFRQLAQVIMTRNHFIMRVNDSYKRSCQLFVRISQCFPEAAVRRPLTS